MGVAASGGGDSTALLHCTCRIAAALGLRVVALHVHHGLQREADTWLERVRGQARRWGAGFAAERLLGRPQPGESVEAWARRGRHEALARLAAQQGCTLVLLAQHRRDQAETVLLQALRGAGAAGLAAMPARHERHGMAFARPWLGQPHAAIGHYLRRHRLRGVEDPSNADPRFARSRLRHAVWPALLDAFGDAEAALALAAERAQDAAAVLAEVAAGDLRAAAGPGGSLELRAWGRLSPARGRELLRAWLAGHLGGPPPHALVRRLQSELPGRAGACWEVAGRSGGEPGGQGGGHDGGLDVGQPGAPPGRQAAGARLRVHRGALHWVAGPLPGPQAGPPQAGLDPQRCLHADPVRSGGIPKALLAGAQWRSRSGGERFQGAPGAVPRSLKKQFQAAAVPAWARAAPLLWSADGRLLFVPGLGTDARALAEPGSPRVALRWAAPPG